MKSLFTYVAVVFLVHGIAFSQTGVPQGVLAAFKAKFPAAKSVEWGKESSSEFEAEFKMDAKEMTASFDTNGNWLETETVLSTDKLPAQIISTLQTQLGNFEVKKAEMLQTAGEPVVFEIKLEKDEKETEVVLDENGKFVKREIKGTEEEQKEEEQEEKKEYGKESEEVSGWTESFELAKADLSSLGKNDYFILEPGYQLVLEGNEGKSQVKLAISVLDETQKIGKVETRIVEEREMANGKLIEVSRNFFAIDKKTTIYSILVRTWTFIKTVR